MIRIEVLFEVKESEVIGTGEMGEEVGDGFSQRSLFERIF